MKIAILYSGQPRHIKQCHENHLKTLFLPNKDSSVDVFAHLWFDENHAGKHFWSTHKERGAWDQDLQIFIEQNLKPKSIHYESPRNFEPSRQISPDPRFPHPINNILSMLYSIETANKLKSDYEQKLNFKYDYVIRARTDEFFLKPIGPIYNYSKDALNALDEWAHLDYGLNDHFAFGSSNIMDLYSNTFSNFLKLIDMGCAINPECLVGFNAQVLNQVKVEKHKWEYKLWRDI